MLFAATKSAINARVYGAGTGINSVAKNVLLNSGRSKILIRKCRVNFVCYINKPYVNVQQFQRIISGVI